MLNWYRATLPAIQKFKMITNACPAFGTDLTLLDSAQKHFFLLASSYSTEQTSYMHVQILTVIFGIRSVAIPIF